MIQSKLELEPMAVDVNGALMLGHHHREKVTIDFPHWHDGLIGQFTEDDHCFV